MLFLLSFHLVNFNGYSFLLCKPASNSPAQEHPQQIKSVKQATADNPSAYLRRKYKVQFGTTSLDDSSNYHDTESSLKRQLDFTRSAMSKKAWPTLSLCSVSFNRSTSLPLQ